MTADYSMAIFPQHARMLAASGITPEHAHARGYVSVDTKRLLHDRKITPAGCNVPGLLVPQRAVDGSVWGYQYRPDNPRVRGGKIVKYETPFEQRNGIDVPPGVGPLLGDPAVPLWITEGIKKADAATLAGLACVALPGVWCWRGKDSRGGKVAIPDWHDIALNDRRMILAFDSDVTTKPAVRRALSELAGYLSIKGARVEFCHLPDDDPGKTGLDDFLTAGHTAADLLALVRPDMPEIRDAESDAAATEPKPEGDRSPQIAPAVPVTLDEVHAGYRHWLGPDYDIGALDAVLAVAAAERLTGDPAWLLVVGGSGAAKTETVIPLAGAGATVTSTITSEGALLSATSRREVSKDATGGLLRKIGDSGVLVIKDVTSILSMSGDSRGLVLAALREVADGFWERNVGTDGGRALTWRGRIATIGAVTTAWDKAHAVVASMGDRFVLVRLDSTEHRRTSGRQAISNTGGEVEMRADLAARVGGLLAGVDPLADPQPDAEEADLIVGLADVVTLARTAVEYDYRGDVIDAHAPEMPTRFAKQLAQIFRGAIALGIPRDHALAIAARCAADSTPPLRLRLLLHLAEYPESTTTEVRKHLQVPSNTADRQLQALHMLGLIALDESEEIVGAATRNVWRYRLTEHADREVLDTLRDARLRVSRFCWTGAHSTYVPLSLCGYGGVAISGNTAEGSQNRTIPGETDADAPSMRQESAPEAAQPSLGGQPECRACGRPADPDNPAGLCGADDHDHRVGWTTAQTGQPWPGNAA